MVQTDVTVGGASGQASRCILSRNGTYRLANVEPESGSPRTSQSARGQARTIDFKGERSIFTTTLPSDALLTLFDSVDSFFLIG